MKNFLFIIVSIITTISFSQSYTLKGYVFDENKEKIPFSNILLSLDKSNIKIGATTDFDGYFEITGLQSGIYTYQTSYIGYHSILKNNFNINKNIIDSVYLKPSNLKIEELLVGRYKIPLIDAGYTSSKYTMTSSEFNNMPSRNITVRGGRANNSIFYTNKQITKPDFSSIPDIDISNEYFIQTLEENTSTFSIDVDNASYTHLRNTILNNKQIPDSSNIRIEEMINYFDYSYQNPKKEKISIYSEIGECAWNSNAKLLHIGIKGKEIKYEELENSNFVFLIDVSGSMRRSIELIKKSLILLVDELTERDKISIVVYAGAAGEVLSATPANEKNKIKKAINNLNAGGSTAGGEGINLAYKIAKANYKKGENNRVILCTDGDFNIGISSREDLIKLIEEKRKDKIFLSVCGFGNALHRDKEMESIADKGNGNYFFIDNEKEANNVFVKKMRSTLFTIAKDFKIQMVFNEKAVKSYRLIGYSNRKLANKDFKNDKKDAGELGAGQSVTALYEIIMNDNSVFEKENLATIKLRYKEPEKNKSKLTEFSIENKVTKNNTLSPTFKFASAVASFGMLVEKKQTQNIIEIKNIIYLAKESISKKDKENREEFIEILKKYKKLK